MAHTISLSTFETIDGLLSQQLRAGDFATCANPRGYIQTSNRLLDACIDAMGVAFVDGFACAEDCAAAIVTQALLCTDFVGE